MTKAIFIFIASLFVLLPVTFWAGEISIATQLLFCLPFILILGIPHGAIDNVLYLRDSKSNNAAFISGYLLFVALNILGWVFVPAIAYLLFIFLSAYHFGQSQFSHYFESTKSKHRILYSLWGIAVLAALILFNLDEVKGFMLASPEYLPLRSLHHEEVLLTLFGLSGVAVISLMFYESLQKNISWDNFIMELLVFGLILLSFYLLPLLVGFTLYFIILHSYKVLAEEYRFLNRKKIVRSTLGFIKLVTPFTLFSIAGIAMLFALVFFGVLELSYGYCLLIAISSITLPHVFVMDTVYDALTPKQYFGVEPAD